MERRLLQRAGYIAGGLVLVAGGILALRNADAPTEQKPPPPPPAQTTVREFAEESVLVPHPGGRPEKPANVRITPGPHRLQVNWDRKPSLPGYEVQLRGAGGLQRTQLLTGTATQFDGLEDDVDYQVDVRGVDAFGQRSGPVTRKQRPEQNRPDDGKYALIDTFDGPLVPDPARWRLANNAACARMARGVGDDSRRLVIGAACGTDSVALRSRTPLRLKDNAGELGRVMIETDAPGEEGELTIDLVPGQADLVETSRRGALPPGTTRVRIMEKTVELPGAPIIGIPPQTGLSARWELVLHTTGMRLWRNGILVASADVVPAWTEATPLFGFTGPANGLNYVGIDAIGLSSGDTPAYVPVPRISTTSVVSSPRTEPLKGVLGGRLRMTVRSNYGVTLVPFTVEVAGRSFPVRPAVDGQVFESGLRYPVVADLPADALVLSGERRELRIAVRAADPRLQPVVQHADLELIPDPAGKPSPDQTESAPEPVQRPRLMVGSLSAALLDAAGGKLENGKQSPRGRVVLEVTMTGSAPLAGLAGIEVWVDSKRIAGIPTNRDGPAVAGQWRIALNAAAFPPGVRNLELRAISADAGSAAQFTTIAWQIPS